MRSFSFSASKFGLRTLAAVLALSSAGSALAATTIASNATDLKVSLSVLGVGAGVTVGSASGSAAPAYNDTHSVAAIDQSLGFGFTNPVTQALSTGVMSVSAQSAFPVTPTGSATATINNLALDAKLLGLTTLSIDSSLITSTTSFDGAVLAGTSSIANLTLANLLGPISFDAGLYASTAANRILVDALGLTVTLNEQINADVVAGGIDTRSLTTNALHVSYKDFLVGGNLLNGDIIVGQSQVSVSQAVPEPATWGMLIVGFGMVGGMLRRSHGQVRALA